MYSEKIIPSTQRLITTISRAITEKYGIQPSAPSLLISWLGDRWYVSILKYGGILGRDKTVICNSEMPILNEALIEVARQFINYNNLPTAMDELKQLI